MKIATADNWYTTHSVGDDVTLIAERHILEYYRCNIWHVRGRDKDLLVDSGMGVVSLREYVPLVTEKPVVAVASHTHFDHIGAHFEFDGEADERLCHPLEVDILASPTRHLTVADTCVSDDIFTQLPPAPYQSTEYNVNATSATRTVVDGDIIDIGDRVFEVIHTPGHSPGGIALWEAKTGILFSGDIVYDGPLFEDAYHSDAADYYASMKRLLDVPVQVVHGGHFPSYGRERHVNIIRSWLDEKDRVG